MLGRALVVGGVALSIGVVAPTSAHADVTVPNPPGVSSSAGLKVIVDNDFALLAGDSSNVTRLIYNNNYSWPDQVTNAATLQIDLQASESYLYLIPMGGGGTEDFGGQLGGLDITGIAGAERATATDGAGGINGYRLIQGSLAGYNNAAVANGTYNVALGDVQTGLSGATWGSAVATGSGSGIPPLYKTDGVGARVTGRAWGFPDSKAVAFRYPKSSVSLPPVRGDQQVQVYWATPADGGSAITDYIVQYRVSSGPGEWQTFNDGTSTSTSATVTGLTNGTQYDFQVAAVNSIGTGAYSSTVSATPATSPSVPLALSASLSGTQADLSWSVPTSNGGLALSDYTVQYRTREGPGSWTSFSHTASTSTSRSVTGLTNGTAYDFRVAAVNAVGTGTYTDPISPSWGATVPGTPTALAATAADGRVSLTWTAPASDGGSAITDYVVEYRVGAGSWTTFADGTSTSLAATVTGLANGTSVEFRVTAVNANGAGTPSATVTATPVAAPSGGGGGGGPSPPEPPAPTPTPTPTPTPSATLDSSAALAPENANSVVPLDVPLPRGREVVVVDGSPVPATVTATRSLPRNPLDGIQVDATGFAIRLASVSSDGTHRPLGPGMTLVLTSSTVPTTRSRGAIDASSLPKVKLWGEGFASQREVRAFILPNWYLGAVDVDADGTFAGMLPIPSGIPAGSYTLQVNGFTPDLVVRSVSVGVGVVPGRNKPATALTRDTVSFGAGSARLTDSARRTLTSLARRYAKRTVAVAIDGYVQRSVNSSNDASLSLARARAVANYLRDRGVTGTIRARGRGAGPENGRAARKVTLTLRYTR